MQGFWGDFAAGLIPPFLLPEKKTLFCPKFGCPPTHPPLPAPPPVHPVLTLYWSVGLSLFQGSGLFFRSQLRGGTGTSAPLRSPPQPQHHHPQFSWKPSQIVPSPGRGRGSPEEPWDGVPGEISSCYPPFFYPPPSAGAGQEQNFPSGKMFLCACVEGWSCLLALNVFGGLGGAPQTAPPALPPSRPGCLELLIVELSSAD